MTRKLAIFKNWKMFAIFKLQYLHQCIRYVEPNKLARKFQFIFRYVKLSIRKFELNYENYM